MTRPEKPEEKGTPWGRESPYPSWVSDWGPLIIVGIITAGTATIFLLVALFALGVI